MPCRSEVEPRQDIETTKEVHKATEAPGIPIRDHLMIGSNGHARFRSLGLL
jgi:DNA repair protein RadC